MKRVILAFVTFLVVACTPTRTSDTDTPIKAVYLVQGEGQLAQNDLHSHPEVLVTNNFDDLKKFSRSNAALWIDINAADAAVTFRK